jgi:hypothetical protein
LSSLRRSRSFSLIRISRARSTGAWNDAESTSPGRSFSPAANPSGSSWA